MGRRAAGVGKENGSIPSGRECGGARARLRAQARPHRPHHRPATPSESRSGDVWGTQFGGGASDVIWAWRWGLFRTARWSQRQSEVGTSELPLPTLCFRS